MAAPSPGTRKTRHKSGSQRSEYLGVGKEFLPSEVPTLRVALRKVLLLQELELRDRRDVKVHSLLSQVAENVLVQWQKSNIKFAPPVIVNKKTIIKRLHDAWEKVGMICWGRANKADKDMMESKLDKLLDLTVCQCEIVLCPGLTETCPLPGKKECLGHIRCDCTKEFKLPLLELKWIFSQRNKLGEKSSLGMVAGDMVETKKQVQAKSRVTEKEVVGVNYNRRTGKEGRRMSAQFQDKEEPASHTSKSALPLGDFLLTDSEEEDDEDDESDLPDLPPPPEPGELLYTDLNPSEIPPGEPDSGKKKRGRKEVGRRNLLPIPSTAAASLR